MPLKKFLPRNSPGVDYLLPINDEDPNGTAYEMRWCFVDNDGVPIEALNVHCTNDGGGIPQEMEVRIGGVLLGNAENSFLGTTYFSGGIASYGNITNFGVLYQQGLTDFSDGLYVSNGMAQFAHSVQCNADFTQSGGYHNIETRPRYSWTTTASANDMELDYSLYHLITGNTTINRILKTGYVPGSPAILKFASNPAINNGAAATGDLVGIKLSGGAFSPAAGNYLELVLNPDGTFWEETGRSLIT